ncbi:hypothetical protein DBR32_09790 [Taibaiella sp. KBW10]|uniref:acyl-CoA dehydrogenase family protein n=1 Tax=Taibaiella sp. KBW10 TaxID=2153357 RepID=UPI000F599BB0|nr:acyl-CoA dehydrogenase family protein [Taibaiella sp. KBW10]RQO30989.1 hypothetical protein DBR32_09790 [Taibaiella sp. KBW10]
MDPSAVTTESTPALEDANIYLEKIQHLIKENYASTQFPNEPFPRADWKKLTDSGIMLSMIPEAYGGRDSHEELCTLIESISRHNLPLGMYTMIITLLFVRNVSKYGTEELKQEVLPLFSTEALIGGFALTEPGCGSNLAKMTTVYEETEQGYHITGQKHWQAFSLSADWWLVAAKNVHNEKEFGYFIVKAAEGFKAVEKYNALGLKAIDYGRNEINAVVPKYRRLQVTSEKLDGAVDMLCASRLSMSAMASGFTARIHEEALERAQRRKIGNGTLYDIGYVQYKLKLIAACKTISKALLVYVTQYNDFRNTLTGNFFEAQAVKTLSTDKMLECALNYQQICGGEGYRYDTPDNSAAYALLDARVYTVFDGTNDLLSQQLAEYCITESVDGNVTCFLSGYEKTRNGLRHIDFDLSLLNKHKTQAQKVLNGQIIARIFGLNCLNNVMQSAEARAFEYEDFRNAAAFLLADIKKIIVEADCLSRL